MKKHMEKREKIAFVLLAITTIVVSFFIVDKKMVYHKGESQSLYP